MEKKGFIVKYTAEEKTRKKESMEFAYQWTDEKGIIHYTRDYKKAEKALHAGRFIEVIVIDNRTKDGTDRVAS